MNDPLQACRASQQSAAAPEKTLYFKGDAVSLLARASSDMALLLSIVQPAGAASVLAQDAKGEMISKNYAACFAGLGTARDGREMPPHPTEKTASTFQWLSLPGWLRCAGAAFFGQVLAVA